ncbi:hypothetical protein Taro_038699 [Colocasia esculenta]|uniref:Uncharacterized protein n=1 Tax=Colocasia esculenta TaxID=4460 RepID=A0A843WTF2_COLES|nr:hypothetical protein [Colocasia esculenta]
MIGKAVSAAAKDAMKRTISNIPVSVSRQPLHRLLPCEIDAVEGGEFLTTTNPTSPTTRKLLLHEHKRRQPQRLLPDGGLQWRRRQQQAEAATLADPGGGEMTAHDTRAAGRQLPLSMGRKEVVAAAAPPRPPGDDGAPPSPLGGVGSAQQRRCKLGTATAV